MLPSLTAYLVCADDNVRKAVAVNITCVNPHSGARRTLRSVDCHDTGRRSAVNSGEVIMLVVIARAIDDICRAAIRARITRSVIPECANGNIFDAVTVDIAIDGNRSAE